MPCSRRFFSGSEQRGGCGLFTVLALAGILLLAAPAFAETEQKPVFHSTFMQLWERHDAWTPSQWDRLCADLAELGVQEIILQWSLLTEPAFYWRLTPDRRAEVPQDRVEPAPAVDLIAQAAQFGWRAWLLLALVAVASLRRTWHPLWYIGLGALAGGLGWL